MSQFSEYWTKHLASGGINMVVYMFDLVTLFWPNITHFPTHLSFIADNVSLGYDIVTQFPNPCDQFFKLIPNFMQVKIMTRFSLELT